MRDQGSGGTGYYNADHIGRGYYLRNAWVAHYCRGIKKESEETRDCRQKTSLRDTNNERHEGFPSSPFSYLLFNSHAMFFCDEGN